MSNRPAAINLDTLLADPPALHLLPDGSPAPFESSERVLRVIDESVGEGSKTLETGAGLSTVLFALRGAEHTCVVPFGTQIARIRDWCAEAGVSLERVTFHQGRSEDVLPRLSDDHQLDLVLIDGGHAFPIPFIDWHYGGRRLGPGGLLIVDDTQLWTGRVLRGFLAAEPGWELVESLPLRAAIFRRTAVEGSSVDWNEQPYVFRRSFESTPGRLVRKTVRAYAHLRTGGPRSLIERLRR
jgi:hypothetical protein